MRRYLDAARHRTALVSFENVVKQQSRSAVVAPVGASGSKTTKKIQSLFTVSI
jgi:hypothetical protein